MGKNFRIFFFLFKHIITPDREEYFPKQDREEYFPKLIDLFFFLQTR